MFTHRGVFWAGVVAVMAGVTLHLPMYVHARDMGFRLVGMPIDAPMIAGMILIVAGLVATIWALIPRRPSMQPTSDASARVRALDDAPIQPAHLALMLVMAAAVT